MDFFSWHGRVAFPKEIPSCDTVTDPTIISYHSQYLCMTMPQAVRSTHLRQMDVGSLTYAESRPAHEGRVEWEGVSHKHVRLHNS